MLSIVFAIILVLWFLGLVGDVGGPWIHLLLVAAGVVFIINLFRSRRIVT